MQTMAIPAGKLAGASGIVEQPDGKFVVVGAGETGSKTADVAGVRVNADGSVDSSFGDGGTSTANLGGSAGAFGGMFDDVLGDIFFFGHVKANATSGDAIIGELTNDSSSATSNPGPTPMLSPTVTAKFPAAALFREIKPRDLARALKWPTPAPARPPGRER